MGKPTLRKASSVALLAFAIAALSDARLARADDAESPSREQVMRELQELREQVRQLESKQATQDAAAKADAAQTQRTTADVISDADRRSSLLDAQGFTAGWSNGKFLIQSEDGNFVLNPNFWLQVRYVMNHRDEDAPDTVSGRPSTESGFEIRRMKFVFDGNAFTPNLKYRFQFNTNRSTGNAFLEDGYASYRFADSWAVKLGQYKEPTFHEEFMSDVRQLAAERSLVNFTLGGGVTDRVQGVALIYDKGAENPFRAEVGFTDGPNSKNTNFQDGGGNALFNQASPDFGLYGRAEYKLMGDWKNYDDFTSLGTIGQMLVVGGGASYSQNGNSNLLLHTVDAQYEAGPVGLYAAYLGAYSDSDATGSIYDAGILLQASYLLTSKWEAFGRFEYMSLDKSQGVGNDADFTVFTAGVNYYMHKHNAKFTLDAMYLPNGSPVNNDAAGILDPDGNEAQFVFRGQFQLLL
jgi:hypothetical protein